MNEDGYHSESVAELADRLQALELENGQLRHALASRIVIEQAKGILAERLGLEIEAAFELLRRTARSNRRPIHGVAEAVVSSRETPPEVAAFVVAFREDAGEATGS
jgi:AmiR/NasT family two-component response regulator